MEECAAEGGVVEAKLRGIRIKQFGIMLHGAGLPEAEQLILHLLWVGDIQIRGIEGSAECSIVIVEFVVRVQGDAVGPHEGLLSMQEIMKRTFCSSFM